MATFTNQTKNTADIINLNKKGAGWRYEEDDLTYEMADLYYNSYGEVISFTNQTKNSASITNLTKS
jgi:hypothetical protein